MEKLPDVHTTVQLKEEIQELWKKVTQLSYEVNSLKLDNDKLKQKIGMGR